MKTTRRGFIVQLLTALGALSLPIGRFFHPGESAGAAEPIGSVRWTQSTPDDFAGGSLDGVEVDRAVGGLALPEGRGDGWYISQVRQAGLTFNAVGSLWDVEAPAGGGVEVTLRTSRDGASWSSWHGVPSMLRGESTGPELAGELQFETGAYLQYGLRLYRNSPASPSPRVRGMTWVCIDSSAGPRSGDLPPLDPSDAVATGVGPPPLVSRAGWGCPEPNASPRWPPEYAAVAKVIVHHTAGPAGIIDDDPAAVMRAMWQYHAVELDWGDIGYNYVVDRNGTIYQGRYGGEGVVAAHARCFNRGSVGPALIGNFMAMDVPPPMQAGLIRVIAWRCFRHGIHPYLSGPFVDRILNNICGHRDANNAVQGCEMVTECPGDFLYNRLSEIRAQTAEAMRWGQWWVGHNTPATMEVGKWHRVRVTVQNRGTRTWMRDASPPFRLGYHWYRPDGSQYTQPHEEDKRNPLPQDVGFGQTVSIDADVFSPREPGQYRLEWDMVEEMVTWFAVQGNETLKANVGVVVSALRYGAQWLGHTVPSSMGAGQPADVTVTARNTSSFTWLREGANPVRLGYRWYREDGGLLTQDAPRSVLPHDVAPDQTVTIGASLTPPQEPGAYIVKWDLVHEGQAWFSDRGVAMLPVTVVVPAPVLVVRPASLYFLADGQTAPRSQSVRILNTGAGFLSWQASSNKGWCTLSAASGTAPSTLFISVDRGAFFPGSSDTATVEIRAASPGTQQSPQQVRVTVVYPSSSLRRSDLPVTFR